MLRLVRAFGFLVAFATLLVGLSTEASATLKTVYSNNSPASDSVLGANNASVEVGSSGWHYDSLRTGATIGINSAIPRSGNGSVLMQSSGGTAKADITYYTGTTLGQPGSALGSISQLTALSYDWYRNGSSTNSNLQSPSIRLYVSDGERFGYLVWEAYYNAPPAPVPTDKWVTSDAYAYDPSTNSGTGLFWGTDTLPGAAPPNTGLKTIADWKSILSGYSVYAVNSGVGSGWNNNFSGAVDNITFGFNGNSTTYNFEVQAVPEPSTVALGVMAGGLTLVAAARRRFQKA